MIEGNHQQSVYRTSQSELSLPNHDCKVFICHIPLHCPIVTFHMHFLFIAAVDRPTSINIKTLATPLPAGEAPLHPGPIETANGFNNNVKGYFR